MIFSCIYIIYLNWPIECLYLENVLGGGGVIARYQGISLSAGGIYTQDIFTMLSLGT